MSRLDRIVLCLVLLAGLFLAFRPVRVCRDCRIMAPPIYDPVDAGVYVEGH